MSCQDDQEVILAVTVGFQDQSSIKMNNERGITLISIVCGTWKNACGESPIKSD